jgi:hypothetical protein
MKQIKTISIKCDNEKTLELSEMAELQGGLKIRNESDYEKIKKSILTYGFSFPFFVWKSGKTNYLLDGHGRYETLKRMREEGYIIPPLPVYYIKAKDKAEAKQKLLRLNSSYGKMTKESVLEFAEDIDLNFDEIALPDTVIDFAGEKEGATVEEGDETNLGDSNFNYNSQFGVIVMCKSEQDQEEVYNRLLGEGFECKVVTV